MNRVPILQIANSIDRRFRKVREFNLTGWYDKIIIPMGWGLSD